MTLNVLIVDDSSFFRGQLTKIINEHPKLKVVGMADNGREAIDKVKKLKPDVVTMDYEMPMMDGVTAVRSIMAENPLPILMLSSMTYEGARITLDALEAGAMDFMTKDFSKISKNSPEIKKKIYDAILTIGSKALADKESENFGSNGPSHSLSNKKQPANSKSTVSPLYKKSFTQTQRSSPSQSDFQAEDIVSQQRPRASVRSIRSGKPKIIAIGASTGGPAALTELLKKIPASFSVPILIIQHMPDTFTKAFAERLNRQCQLTIKEAETGDLLKPGHVYLAPGGKQLIINSKNTKELKVIDTDKPVNYKPCVDITYASLSNTHGSDTLAIVMTGMGRDGCDGAHLLKSKGSRIWTQNEKSCLIYGMPMAVDKANLSDATFDINGIADQLLSF
jgi:two-component system chemotaxis response regulator CheB